VTSEVKSDVDARSLDPIVHRTSGLARVSNGELETSDVSAWLVVGYHSTHGEVDVALSKMRLHPFNRKLGNNRARRCLLQTNDECRASRYSVYVSTLVLTFYVALETSQGAY